MSSQTLRMMEARHTIRAYRSPSHQGDLQGRRQGQRRCISMESVYSHAEVEARSLHICHALIQPTLSSEQHAGQHFKGRRNLERVRLQRDQVGDGYA